VGTCQLRVTGLGDVVPHPTADNFRRYEKVSPATVVIQPDKNQVTIELTAR
jgi:hypothetical protein